MAGAGFEDELRQIIKILPRDRQTMLFSATLSNSVRDIMRVCSRASHRDAKATAATSGGDDQEEAAAALEAPSSAPVFVNVAEPDGPATVAGLEQGFVVCESDQRFLLLFTFLKKNRNKKIIVFFSTCNAVKFYSELLNYIDLPVLDLHGQQKQKKRTGTFFEFCNSPSGALLCTDVAARGLDIPAVDWIIQFDPPDVSAPRDCALACARAHRDSARRRTPRSTSTVSVARRAASMAAGALCSSCCPANSASSSTCARPRYARSARVAACAHARRD
jgi:ATP-dependent RNA helicase DDX18/HAS1